MNVSPSAFRNIRASVRGSSHPIASPSTETFGECAANQSALLVTLLSRSSAEINPHELDAIAVVAPPSPLPATPLNPKQFLLAEAGGESETAEPVGRSPKKNMAEATATPAAKTTVAKVILRRRVRRQASSMIASSGRVVLGCAA